MNHYQNMNNGQIVSAEAGKKHWESLAFGSSIKKTESKRGRGRREYTPEQLKIMGNRTISANKAGELTGIPARTIRDWRSRQ